MRNWVTILGVLALIPGVLGEITMTVNSIDTNGNAVLTVVNANAIGTNRGSIINSTMDNTTGKSFLDGTAIVNVGTIPNIQYYFQQNSTVNQVTQVQTNITQRFQELSIKQINVNTINVTAPSGDTYTMPTSAVAAYNISSATIDTYTWQDVIVGNTTVTTLVPFSPAAMFLGANTAIQIIVNSQPQMMGRGNGWGYSYELNPWYNQTWKYREMLTINNTLSTDNLTNFTLLVHLNNTRINYTYTQTAGQDIRFTDSDGATPLSYEIENWTNNSNSYLWVKVPNIPNGSYYNIFMYYNNSKASDGQQVSNTWNSDYMGVWHLNQNPNTTTATIKDSTSHGFNLSGYRMWTNQSIIGKMNRGIYFNATPNANLSCTDAVCGGTSGLDTGIRNWSMQTWVYIPGKIGGFAIGGKMSGFTGVAVNVIFEHFSAGTINPSFGDGTCNGGNGISPTADGTRINDSTWDLVTITYNRSSNLIRYFNGTQTGTNLAISSCAGSLDDSGRYDLGNREAANLPYNGSLEEWRVAATVWTPSWIKADYLSQSDMYISYGIPTTNGDSLFYGGGW